ncbi:MAG: hypothetical protein ABIL69_11050 [candidate division WOR-3 bacterium]
MKLIPTKNFELLLIKYLSEVSYNPHHIIPLITGKPYCLTGIYVPYLLDPKNRVDNVKRILGYQEPLYCIEYFIEEHTIEMLFENQWKDYVLVNFRDNDMIITIFSERREIYAFYKDKIEKLTNEMDTKTDDGIRILWRCFLDQKCSDYAFTMKLPKKYDKIIPLTNYQNETRIHLEALEEVLEKDNYCGRIIILEGVPGTGKSYYIRRLVSKFYQKRKIKDVYYFLGWGVYALNVNHCLDNNLLIFEDSDWLLTSGKSRNEELVRILNFSSGFIDTSALFVFTTNLKLGEIDEAFIRDGRLLARIKFNTFNREEAREWLATQNCNVEIDQDEYTLANLYARTNKQRRIMNHTKLLPIGFRMR